MKLPVRFHRVIIYDVVFNILHAFWQFTMLHVTLHSPWDIHCRAYYSSGLAIIYKVARNRQMPSDDMLEEPLTHPCVMCIRCHVLADCPCFSEQYYYMAHVCPCPLTWQIPALCRWCSRSYNINIMITSWHGNNVHITGHALHVASRWGHGTTNGWIKINNG